MDLYEKCIENGMLNKRGNLNSQFLLKLPNFPFYEEINSLYPSTSNLSEKLYLLNHERGRCEVCENYTQFNNYSNGYYKTCSDECNKRLKAINTSNNLKGKKRDPQIFEKMKETRKINNSNLKTSQSLKKTNREKYGVDSYFQTEEFKKKSLDTLQSKYHTNLNLNGLSYNEAKFLIQLFSGNRLDNDVIPNFKEEEFKGVYRDKGYNYYSFKCNKCGTIFDDYLAFGNIPTCPHCNPIFNQKSKGEDEIASFVESLGFDIIRNDREIIYPQELDIYIPSKNLAIEFDGLYWHSTLKKSDPNYHLNKTIECEKKGIRLIHIFEDEWVEKREIVEDIIKAALGIYNKIYARECKVVIVDSKTQESFLNENHIQGYVKAKYGYGLIHKGELISLATFSKSRYSNEDWELIRYVNKKDLSVIGGFSRLLNHFKRDHKGSIVTYSDRRLFTANTYRSCFEFAGTTNPDYFYVKNNRRYNRQLFQKKNLVKKYPQYSKYTEEQIMRELGYYRIYGCGNWKFIDKQPYNS